MADDPPTGKEGAEEEAELEGKASDSTVNATGSDSQNAGKSDPDSAENSAAPAAPQSEIEADSPLATQSTSKNTSLSGGASNASKSLSKTPTPSRNVSNLNDARSDPGSTSKNKSQSSTLMRDKDESLTERDDEPGKIESDSEALSSQPQSATATPKPRGESPRSSIKDGRLRRAPLSARALAATPTMACRIFERRSPFMHNPPYPEERRPRVLNPRCPRDYIINLREDLADFQESHGLPRTRDYNFVSLGLSLAQETGRAIYGVFMMITELFPIAAIVSLVLRFALDKVIEILETEELVPRIKKSIVFVLQILVIMIPLWILVGTIVIPLFYLILTIFRKMFRLPGRKKGKPKTRTARHPTAPTHVNVKK